MKNIFITLVVVLLIQFSSKISFAQEEAPPHVFTQTTVYAEMPEDG